MGRPIIVPVERLDLVVVVADEMRGGKDSVVLANSNLKGWHGGAQWRK